MRRILVLPVVLALVSVLLNAGPGHSDEPQTYVATIKTAQGKYRAVLTDPEMIERQRSSSRGAETPGCRQGSSPGATAESIGGTSGTCATLRSPTSRSNCVTAQRVQSTVTPSTGSRRSGSSALGQERS